jgi:transposase-like protein
VLTDLGPVDLEVPRDRAGTFEPKIVPKNTTRLGRFNDNIIAWYSRGLSTRDIRRELKRMYGVEVSPELISRVTNGVLEELRDWQSRPLDACYPIVYIDALVVKVRTQGTVVNRPAYLAIGVDTDGRKHIFGVWLGDGGEGAKFWMSILSEVRNRGVADVIFCCCDGLKGLPEAIEAIWPQAIVQTCTVHLVRASIRYCSYKDRKKITAALRTIYTAPSLEAAQDAMDTFELEHGDRYPGIVALWRNSWERFTPFLAYPPIIRKIIYTTNMIVISSSSRPVFHVQHRPVKSLWLLDGHDYLRLVHRVNQVEELCMFSGWRYPPRRSSRGRCWATMTARSNRSSGSWHICPISSDRRTPSGRTRMT